MYFDLRITAVNDPLASIKNLTEWKPWHCSKNESVRNVIIKDVTGKKCKMIFDNVN